MAEDLQGRVALVTGVSRRAGIGYTITRRLIDDGASVFWHSWSPHDVDQSWGADALGIAGVIASLGAPEEDRPPGTRSGRSPECRATGCRCDRAVRSR